MRHAASALLVTAFGGLAAAAPAQTVEELAARHLEARGGAAVAAARSVRMVGTVHLSGGLESTEGRVVVELAPPAGQARIDLALGEGSLTTVYDGSRGWRQAGGRPPVELTGEDLASIRRTAAFAGLLTPAPGRRIELAGRGSVAGRPTHVLHVVEADGGTWIVHLDAESHLELMEQRRNPQGGLVVQGTLGDFRQVGGVTFPYTSHTSAIASGEGAPAALWSRVTWERIELDVELPPGRFALAAGGGT